VYFRRTFTPARVRFGEETHVNYTLENHKWLPVPWLEIEDEIAVDVEMPNAPIYPSYKPDRQIFITALALWARQRVTRRYRLVPLARGVWNFGPTYLRAGDPFGFLDRDVRISQQGGDRSLMVLPIVAPLDRFGLPARNPFGDLAAQRRLIEDPSQVIGARDYQAGDPLRRVHWKATARSDTLQSKVYPYTVTQSLALFFDIHTSSNASQGFDTALFELGIAGAASIAAWAQKERYAVGLFSNGIPSAGSEHGIASFEELHSFMRVPLSPHPAQLQRLLEALARMQPYFGISMQRLIAREQHALPIGATIVYITAAVALSPNVVAQLERLKRRGYVVAVLLTGDAPADTRSLLTYRLGGEESWNDLITYATRRFRHEPDHQDDAGRGGDNAGSPGDSGPGAGGTRPADSDRRQPAFAVG